MAIDELKRKLGLNKTKVATDEGNDLHGLIHELRTHQIELEMQNEELRQAQVELLEAHNRYSDLFDFAPVGYLTLSPKGIILNVNLTFTEMVFRERGFLIGKTLALDISKESQDTWYLFLSKVLKHKKHQVCEINMLAQDASSEKQGSFWARVDGRPITDAKGEIYQIHLSFHDISEQRQNQLLLHHQAFYDLLTDLPNRQLFINRFSQYLAQVSRSHCHGALLYIDIDNFKFINDSLGHSSGDRILQQFANELRLNTRAEDTAARLGGDEFVVLLTELNEDKDHAVSESMNITNKIRAAIIKPFHHEGCDLQVEVSIGVTLFPNEAKSVEEIMSCADIAMYQAKNNGKNSIRFFHQEMYNLAKNRLDIYEDLRSALTSKEFGLVYQSIVNQDRQVIGAECLLRWQHPTKGEIICDDFIPILEESNLIIEAGSWVLTHACEQLVRWQALGAPFSDYRLAVNVSPKQFNQSNFLDLVEDILNTTKANPARLVLEITENMLLTNIEATIDKMNRLKQIGIFFSIDDFGMGYSSLSYIKRLPLDTLKIDRSFVRNIHQEEDSAILVDTIIAMAKHLKLEVIAEGVEKEEERAKLIKKGCHCFQGYLFCKPVSINEFESLKMG